MLVNNKFEFNENLLQQKQAVAILESQKQESSVSLFSEFSEKECKASVS